MGRGFLAGIFWGALVGVALLFVSSQALERQQLSFPQPEASPVEVPGGTEFDQARPETDPVLPEAETRPGTDAITGVVPPEDVVDTPPAFDTSALDVPTPVVEAPQGLGAMPDVEEDAPTPAISQSVDDVTSGSDPELVEPDVPGTAPEPEVEAPVSAAQPEDEAGIDELPEQEAPVVETEVAALPGLGDEDAPAAATQSAPVIETGDAAPGEMAQPEISDAPTLPEISAAEGPAPAVTAPEAMDAPDAGGDTLAEGESFFQPVESIGNLTDGVETERLPRITEDAGESDAASVPDETPADEGYAPETAEADTEAQEDTTENAAMSRPALEAYGMAFENPDNLPLLSIVLVPNEAARLSEAQLADLPDVIGFAVDAGAPGAYEVAAYYRENGREVALIPSLPENARPQDVEQALRVNFERVPEAVVVMDVTGGSFQSDRSAVGQIVEILAGSGHGLVTYPRGLNTAHQQAGRAGVPTGLIFRNIDANGESGAQIRRTLDRAAFRARQNEAVILVGSTESATLAAILEWALGARSTNVLLAPLSAAMQEQ